MRPGYGIAGVCTIFQTSKSFWAAFAYPKRKTPRRTSAEVFRLGQNSPYFIVGMEGFEPTASPTRTARASRTAPHPEAA